MGIKARDQLQGIKPYIPGKNVDEVKRELGISEVIKLASNENPLGPAPSAIQAINQAMKQLHVYPDGNATLLKKALSNHLGVSTSHLIVGNGSDEILKLIGEAYLCPGDEVVIADKTFSEYEFVARLMGADIRYVPLKNYRHDLSAMLDAVTERTKIVFVCNPNNPTGTIVGQDELVRFLAKIPANILVIVDEAYYEYVQAQEYPQTIGLLEQYPNIIITRTFSKVYALAALRVGYAIANPDIISNMHRVKEPFNVNSLGQVAACASLTDHDHVHKSVALNETGKSYLYREFEKLGLEYVETETNFILVDVKEDAKALFERLLHKGIIIRSAHVFDLPTFIRVTIGTPHENQAFISTLKESLTHADRD